MENRYISKEEQNEVLEILKLRFEKNMNRHIKLKWENIENKLINNPSVLSTLSMMENTGGEPDVISYDKKSDEYTFVDCSKESPIGRRSLCYDGKALKARKKNKPKNSAIDLADNIGIKILDESEYRELQALGNFDMKTSSWIKTPESIRALGGALFCDFRYNTVFVYHNGAQSYYQSRGFRGLVKV
jgi:hypothetical protein